MRPPAATRDELVALLVARDPLRAARRAGVEPPARVTVRRGPAPGEWLVDDEDERPVEDHRAAHLAGRPSEAAVRYGAGVDPEATVDRLRALAALHARTGLLRAVTLVPADGGRERPGSWGVEDLTAVAVARLALGDVPVRPHWRRLGPGAAQVALSFGASGWALPADDTTDVAHLAAAVGCEAVTA